MPASSFNNFFVVSDVKAGSFTINNDYVAATGGTFSVAGQTATPKYSEIAAGDNVRSKDNGTFTADLSGNTTSPYYTINVSMAVDDGNGNISSSVVTYKVNNNDTNLINARYAAGAATKGRKSSSSRLDNSCCAGYIGG